MKKPGRPSMFRQTTGLKRSKQLALGLAGLATSGLVAMDDAFVSRFVQRANSVHYRQARILGVAATDLVLRFLDVRLESGAHRFVAHPLALSRADPLKSRLDIRQLWVTS